MREEILGVIRLGCRYFDTAVFSLREASRRSDCPSPEPRTNGVKG
ncbi:unnamed protein product [Spirodela intermedia]|uniref:Uncharacterized protein n=1 Tax=Spirodela intermedia TaxID=51605 RepID=A0A7I8J3U5_SPIIN|nr:unnamed protein product [Spirodela intermedia]CAA6664731.1 unnamed protein product [Spirodela intermedia]